MVKHTQTIRLLLPTNCLSVFGHFVGLALKCITWFNPPYSVNMETNIGKTFLKLIDKHLTFTFQKLTSSTKYSTETIAKMIKSHNNRLL